MDYKKIDYEKMYEDIMNIDAGIRLVTICDSHGRVVYSEHREGVKNLLTPEESKESLELAVNSWKTRTKLAPKIGKGKYVLAEYEKIKRITMPLGDDDHHLLYITTEVQADHSNIIRRVREITIRKLLL
jgi:plasmid stability protein